VIRSSILACALLLSVGTALAQGGSRASLSEVFEAANVAASQGDQARAVSGYQTLIEAGVRDADVYFNLATAYAQSEDYPRAILNYERALVLDPNDDKTKENLRQAEKSLEERRAEAEGEATIQRGASIGDAVYGFFSEDVLAYLVLGTNFCLFACLGWAWAVRRRNIRLIALMTVSGALLAFSSLGLAVKAGALRDGPRAVALAERVVLREGPDERARARGEARGGDRVLVVGADGDFVKLRVIHGLEGWATASEVGVIDLDEGAH
jgi:tetratricopeptide (TPR) repeat protein